MDRDKRWERLKVGYEMLVGGVGEKSDKNSIVKKIESRYHQEPSETDEFLKPIIVVEDGRIKGKD